MLFVHHFAVTTVTVITLLLAGAGFLHVMPHLGSAGRRFSMSLCRAPGLDWVVTYFTVGPLIVGPVFYGAAGFLGGLAGQITSVLLWTWLHELANLESVSGPRIVKENNRLVGRWQNHTALWLTAIVTPMFWVVRMAEIFLYPPIQKLTGFPSYKGTDWVSVSRQKFAGLVGHDLIWCLYCDWMTGIWSLGTEMLRNVESFWCPIRFADGKKCANCTLDFPDLDQGWVAADGNLAQVTEVLEKMHGQGFHGWFGHPVRLTVKGNPVETTIRR